MASMGGGYNAGTAYVNIKPKLDRFATELKSKLATVQADHKVDIRADTTGFAAQVRAALATIPETHTIRINVKANTEQIRKDIDSLGRSRSTELGLSLDTGTVERQLTQVTRDREVDIDAKVNSRNVAQDINRITRSLGRRRAIIKVDADTSGAQRAVVVLGRRLQGLDRYQRHVALTASGYTLLGAAIAGVVGPAASLTGHLISAAGVLATLPAIIGGAIGGIAALATGLSGVGAAFGAMGKSAGGAGGATEKSMRAALRAVERARRGIEMAERGVRDATEGVEDAYRRIAKAEKALQDAQDRSRRAQDDLNRARKEATRELRDMNEQLMDAALDEEGAVLAVAQAKKRLEETLADSGSDELDIRMADLDYRKSLDALQDVRRENNRLAEAVSDANRAGVEGSEQVVKAHEEIADAQEAEQDAAQDLQDSHRNLRNAYEKLADAEYNLAEAHKDLEDALANLNDAASGASGGVDAFAEAMANLSEEARKFVLAIQALGPAWKELRLAAQDALFKDLGIAVTTLAERQLPVLKDGFVDINTEINKGIRSSLHKFSTEIAAVDFKTFLNNTAGLFQGLAMAAAPLSQIWIDLATVGSEYLPRMGGAVAGAFSNWSQSITSARADGSLNEMIDNGIAAFSRLSSFVGEVGGTVAGVFRAAAAAGDPFFFRVEQAFTKMHEWTDSLEGQNTLKDFFAEASQAVQSAMPALAAIGGFLTGTLMPIVESLVTGIAPGVTNIVNQLSETFLLGESAFQMIGEAAGGILTTGARLLDFWEPLHKVLFWIVEAFMGMPDHILYVVAAFVALKKLKLFDFLEKGNEGFKGLSVEMRAQRAESQKLGGSLGTLGGYFAALETRSSTISKMGQAFRNASFDMHYARMELTEVNNAAAKGAPRVWTMRENMLQLGGTMKGVGAAGFSAFKSGLGGIMGLLGGPWGLAFTIATGVVTGLIDAHKRADEAQAQMAKTANMTTEAQEELTDAIAGTNGELSEEGLAAAAKVAEAGLNDFMAMGKQLDGWLFNSSRGVEEYWEKLTGKEIVTPEDLAIAQGLIKGSFKEVENAARDAGIPMDELHHIIAEGGDRYDELIGSLDTTKESGKLAAQMIGNVKDELELSIDAARRVDPAMLAVRDAVKVLADEASTAEDKLGAMRTILQQLGLFPKDAKQAMFEAAEGVRELLDSIEGSADQLGAFGEDLFLEGTLELNWDVGNSQELNRQLVELADNLHNVAANGGDIKGFYESQVLPTLAAMEKEFRLADGVIEDLASQFGLEPKMLQFLVDLEGADDVEQELKALVTGMAGAKVGNKVEIPVKMATEDAVKQLEDFGVKLLGEGGKSADGLNWQMQIEDENAKKVLDWWATEGFEDLGATVTAGLELDDSGFVLKTDSAVKQLTEIDTSRPFPWANLDISKLSDEQRKALEQVGILDESGAIPVADLNIDELTAEQQVALSKVFDLDEKEPTPHADMNSDKFDDQMKKANKDADDFRDRPDIEPKMGIDLEAFWDGLVEAKNGLLRFLGWQKDAVKEGEAKDIDLKRGAGLGTTTDGKKIQGPVIPGHATGGQHEGYRLPTTGPGTGMVDGFLALDANGMPTARLDAGEWVINGKASEEYHDELAAINAGTFPKIAALASGGFFGALPGYASGGIVQSGVEGITPHQQGMWDIIRTQFPDAELSSAKRNWGTGDYHDQGLAIDLGGGWRNDLQAIATWIGANYPHSSELYWDPGPNIKNGQRTGAIGGHSDHVHWAMVNPPGSPVADQLSGLTSGMGITFGDAPTDPYWSQDYGLSEYDTDDAGVALDPLTRHRQSDASNPNNIDYKLDGKGGRDAPNSWSGIAGNFAKMWAEGQTRELLTTLGLSDDPGILKSYNMYNEGRATGTRLARERAQQSMAKGATDSYFSENDPTNLAAQGAYTSPNFGDDWAIVDGKIMLDMPGVAEGLDVYKGVDGSDPVQRWRPLARQALSRHGYNPDDHIDAMMKQIDIESSGDPSVFNYWDSNAKMGDPSGGLLQVIGATYRDVRSKYPSAFEGLPDDRLYPLTNLTAGVGAVRRDWGGPGGRWPTRDGYANGGFVEGLGGPTSDIIPAMLSDGEFVTRAMSTAVARPLLEAMNVDPGLAAHMNQHYLDGAAGASSAAPIELHYHIETNNLDEGMRRAELHASRHIAAMSGR